jgi:transposase
MIMVSPQTRILVQVDPIDFRKGLDSLVSFCREVLQEDPFSSTLFLFRNSQRTAIKVLMYDGQGFWLMQKRFSEGKILHWPVATDVNPTVANLAARELHTLLWNGDPVGASYAPEWKKVSQKD